MSLFGGTMQHSMERSLCILTIITISLLIVEVCSFSCYCVTGDVRSFLHSEKTMMS
jgi:hypothetical protein